MIGVRTSADAVTLAALQALLREMADAGDTLGAEMVTSDARVREVV